MSKEKNTAQQRQIKIDARRHYDGPAFLDHGFRPFFLGAAIWAFFAILLWIATWLGFSIPQINIDSQWHMHEMLFGFAPAAIIGFLLTAIPNWTGRLPVRGMALLILFSIWVAGRAAMLFQEQFGILLSTSMDAAFLIAASLMVFREIISGRNWRNLKIALILSGLAGTNIWFHLEQNGFVVDDGKAMRGAISLLVLLLALIGGRIIPSFTRNALKQRGARLLPAQTSNTDRFTLIATLLAGCAFTMVPNSILSASLAIVCAALHFERLTRWRGLHVLFEPMLVILHLSYAWIAIGFAILGASTFFDFLTQSAAIHAFTTGAFSSMILAVMSRASRGHTGRPLRADAATNLVYIAITLAAILRVLGAMFAGVLFHQMATIFWLLAFGVFIVSYWPVLTKARQT